MANRIVTTDVSDNIIAGAVMADFFLDKSARLVEAHASDHTKVVVNKGEYYIPFRIGNYWFLIDTASEVDLDTDMDTGVKAAGTDYNLYACTDGSTLSFKISANSTYPSGFTSDTSRKIGGFHTLCAAVGTISGHTLTGYLQTDILPQSIWDIKHRARCGNNAGMVYDEKTGIWVDIYLASGTGAATLSVNGGTISDSRNWMDFVDDGGAVGKRLLTDSEFQNIAAGGNEETNIAGSADPGTTGGHSDTASRRMISNIGCEDCAGAMYQWLQDQSYREPAAPGWNWYDLPGAKGSIYNYGGTTGDADVKLLAGGHWSHATYCGSRARGAHYYRWTAYSYIGARFASEPK